MANVTNIITSAPATPDQSVAICTAGNIRTSTQLPVLTVDLGPVCQICDTLEGVIEKADNGSILICSKEHPEGFAYDSDLNVVVRIIGNKVVDSKGRYDIYCPGAKAYDKAFSRGVPVDSFADLPKDEKAKLERVLACASSVRAVLTPAKPGRRVIEITEELMNKVGAAGTDDIGPFLSIHESYDDKNPDSRVQLHVGDIFLVEHMDEMSGYPINGEVFRQTEVFTD